MVATNDFLFEHVKSKGLHSNGRNNNTPPRNHSSFRVFCQRTEHSTTAEQTIEVSIVEHTGCTYTLGNEENLPIYIHESLIIDNGLTHDPSQNSLQVPLTLYNAWLQTARNEALHTEKIGCGASTPRISHFFGATVRRFLPTNVCFTLRHRFKWTRPMYRWQIAVRSAWGFWSVPGLTMKRFTHGLVRCAAGPC